MRTSLEAIPEFLLMYVVDDKNRDNDLPQVLLPRRELDDGAKIALERLRKQLRTTLEKVDDLIKKGRDNPETEYIIHD
jgi:hypothetical protein